MPPSKARIPALENRIAKIPLPFDDWALYRGKMTYGQWEQKAIQTIRDQEFTAIGLHDCYAQYWIENYEHFLRKISGLGTLKKIDTVANRLFLSHAQ